jgi:hypothetical protein
MKSGHLRALCRRLRVKIFLSDSSTDYLESAYCHIMSDHRCHKRSCRREAPKRLSFSDSNGSPILIRVSL